MKTLAYRCPTTGTLAVPIASSTSTMEFTVETHRGVVWPGAKEGAEAARNGYETKVK